MDRVVDELRRKFPKHTGSWRLSIPEKPYEVITGEYYDPPDRPAHHGTEFYALVNPYNAEIVATWYWNETVLSWIYTLHMYLQLGVAGHDVVGWFGVILLFITLGGLYLWWPRGRPKKSDFLMSFRAPWLQIEYLGHKLSGFYSLIVIFIVTVSGIAIVFPEEVGGLIGEAEEGTGPATTAPEPGKPGANSVGAATALRVALQRFPGAQPQMLVTPDEDMSVYRVILRQDFENFTNNLAQTRVSVDRFSGKIVEVHDHAESGIAANLLGLSYALHTGEVVGETGRVLVFLTGPVILWLYVTGVTRWLRRRRLARIRQRPTRA
jgi:uncharacterized iron-regulated membrane protein